MTRRYGRVSVEGWISDGTVVIPPDQTAYWSFPAAHATVEYLPQPVVFNDDDVIRCGRFVWVRDGGLWHCSAGANTPNDDHARGWLRYGIGVRLIPEATS